MNSSQNWFVHDHTQHEQNLSRCKEAIKMDDWDKASSIFNEFVTELKSHIAQEEEKVFPNYIALVKITHDPTKSLRAEHVQIFSFLKDVQQFINTHDAVHGLKSLQRLEEEISKHEEKEEEIFLPMAGYVLDPKYWETRGQPGSAGSVDNDTN